MLDELVGLMTVRLKEVKPLGIKSHLSPGIINTIEDELLQGELYERAIPKDYPSDSVERSIGARRIFGVLDASLLNMRLRIGRTRLHINDRRMGKNPEAIVITYVGEALVAPLIGEGYNPKSKIVLGSELGIVNLLENGTISGYYLDVASNLTSVISWHPKERTAYGIAYPASLDETKKLVEDTAKFLGLSAETKTLRAYPHMVMFAADTYRMADTRRK